MSYDIKIQNKCDHKINWEAVDLESDRRTIYPNYPIGSRSSAALRINYLIKDSSEYVVKQNKTSLEEAKPYYLYMNNKVKDYEPIIEISYVTFLETCPKCSRTKYVDDIAYDAGGNIVTIENEFLLLQNVEKYIITNINSNSYQSWLGTNLINIVGSKLVDFDYVKTSMVTEVNTAIEKLKDMQKQYMQTRRKVNKGELFGQLISVEVNQDTSDPTLFYILVKFTSQAGKNLEYTQVVEFSEIRQRLGQ